MRIVDDRVIKDKVGKLLCNYPTINKGCPQMEKDIVKLIIKICQEEVIQRGTNT